MLAPGFRIAQGKLAALTETALLSRHPVALGQKAPPPEETAIGGAILAGSPQNGAEGFTLAAPSRRSRYQERRLSTKFCPWAFVQLSWVGVTRAQVTLICVCRMSEVIEISMFWLSRKR